MLVAEFFEKLLRCPGNVMWCEYSLESNLFYSGGGITCKIVIQIFLFKIAEYHHGLRETGHSIRFDGFSISIVYFALTAACQPRLRFRKTHDYTDGLTVILTLHGLYFNIQ